ncbi:sialate o-acetylesterase-like [Plakobranchus ocellatus]|uniref:Sialate o-acetylesterase-like n=1 Tax=Plakobranchus ocellatus TaxID=259542 RepID=A0AAV4DFY2_9GAST|nr:sialate o-acetylesterase-like [Plakobranchus ocellatus]
MELFPQILYRGVFTIVLFVVFALVSESRLVFAEDVIHMKQVEDLNILKDHVGTPPVALTFAKHFQNGMVLQREPHQANIYGFSPNIGGKLVMTVKNSDSQKQDYYETTVKQGDEPGVGVWMFTLNPAAAGTSIFMRVEGEEGALTLDDVIFGDVWVCSGQSNMEFTVSMMLRAKEELQEAHNYPNIRIFSAQENVSKIPLDDLIGVLEPWSKPSNASLGGKPWSYFSAVCWLFGKNIHKTLGIPIGLVDTNWGGTPVEAWSSPDALKKCNITSNVNGPTNNSVLWNAMVNPLLGMTIFGAIWYQGEQDSSPPNVNRYNCTFPAMIDDWREKFYKASNGETSIEFPFGFVQLSANAPDPSISFGFPDIRWHQTADYGFVPNPRMSNVFMAVAMDLPGFTSKFGSIHPQDKTDVGYRLALSGLQYAYGKTEACQGPYPKTIMVAGDLVNITYMNTQKLEIRDWSGFEVLCAPSTGARSWLPTSVVQSFGTTVSVYASVCPAGQKIGGLRYAWRESPCAFKKCAVYGSESGLPAPPFVSMLLPDANGVESFKLSGPTSI